MIDVGIIRLQYVCGSDWSSRAITRFSAGPFSHVDTILDDGRLLGARSDWVKTALGWIKPGVRIRPAEYEKFAARAVIEIECARSQRATYLNFLMHQLGQPYDRIGIAGFIFDRDWRDPRAWFCSELVTRGFELAHLIHPIPVPVYKITPVASSVLATGACAGRITYASPHLKLRRAA